MQDKDRYIDDLYGVILAGGSGTRLWPLSRELTPKQLLSLFGTESLIRQAVTRILPAVPEENVFIVANKKLCDEIKAHLSYSGKPLKEVRYLVEPEGRNTAPAIGLAAARIATTNPEATIAVFPSDHIIEGGEPFMKILRRASELADKGYLVTLGLVPTRPETGFGYIKAGALLTENKPVAHEVERFVEKPDRETAETYLSEGDYYWNSGIFVFKAKDILAQIAKSLPGLDRSLAWFKGASPETWESDNAKEAFSLSETTSIDYGIMEKAERVAVVPMSLKWHDVGSFNAISDFYEADEDGNIAVGNTVQIDCRDSIVYADRRLVATVGLEGTIVVDTHDATLVCSKERAQDVRKVVDVLKGRQAEEFLTHRTVYRPWGSYTMLEKGAGFKIKTVEVKPGAKLSLQLHRHRSEHWVIISGTAKITRAEETFDLHPGESTFIPISIIHRIENQGVIPIKLIEVQNGEYLEEDDIVRFHDDYERNVESTNA